MRIEYFLIGIVVFSIFVTFGGLMIQDTRNNYNIAEDPNSTYFRSSYDTIGEMGTLSASQKNSVLNNTISSTDATSSAISGSYGAIRFLTKAITLPVNIASDACTSIVPGAFMCSYWITIVGIVLTILIVFSIIYLFISRWIPS